MSAFPEETTSIPSKSSLSIQKISREEDSGTQERKNEGEKETGRGGDSRESEVVPVWREKALCSLPADRPVKLRRLRATDQRDLQGFAPSSVEAVILPSPHCSIPSHYLSSRLFPVVLEMLLRHNCQMGRTKDQAGELPEGVLRQEMGR
ncbi:hypothetical protein NQZ68_000218 [Dissostichus eleginoides]|nr:hypothetical protein NQZ68_000218 [Dissostichus eleginoides]